MQGSQTVGVVIPTFGRDTLDRAVASANVQTAPVDHMVIVDDGVSLSSPAIYGRYGRRTTRLSTGRADGAFLSWCDGAHAVGTDIVCILFDDDWYEPTFIERTLTMMGPDVGYVFTDATIHFADGTSRRNLPGLAPTGYIPSDALGDMLLQSTSIITPSCCMFRREDVLANLFPGNVPCMPHNDIISGSDALLAMLPLLKYPRVGWINEPLVHLDGGAQSTTIREMSGPDGGAALHLNYDNARRFFAVMREAKRQCAL